MIIFLFNRILQNRLGSTYVFELLDAGVLKSGINRNKYVTTAILEKLERDGFT